MSSRGIGPPKSITRGLGLVPLSDVAGVSAYWGSADDSVVTEVHGEQASVTENRALRSPRAFHHSRAPSKVSEVCRGRGESEEMAHVGQAFCSPPPSVSDRTHTSGGGNERRKAAQQLTQEGALPRPSRDPRHARRRTQRGQRRRPPPRSGDVPRRLHAARPGPRGGRILGAPRVPRHAGLSRRRMAGRQPGPGPVGRVLARRPPGRARW